MDRLESLTNTLSQITMYDIKNMYNQAKNVVLNVSEMEGKVREATNDEAWGASSTLMQEIAQGTFNFQNFNEIMPCIYTRFMEKEAKQWRQIYKALQLLEYLIKNGSERVVDDARSHIATIKMLRNFYYIDEKGKDQGLNVRNRAKELVDLLGDVDKIRSERRKAKTNKNKYTGVGNDALSFSSGGGRYGGFGSDSLGGGSSSYGGDYSGRDYGDYSSGSTGGFRDSSSRRNYEEYDAGDDDVVSARRSNSLSGRGSASSPAPRRSAITPSAVASPIKAKAPEPVPDLLGLDDDFGAPVTANVVGAQPVGAAPVDIDDDFADFQAAPLSPAPGVTAAPLLTSIMPPAARPASQGMILQQTPLATQQPSSNLFNMLASNTTVAQPATAPRASSFTSPALTPTAASFSTPALTPSVPRSNSGLGSRGPASTVPAAKPASSGGFDDLWTMSLGGASAMKPQAQSGPAKSIQDLQKEKAQAGIWGSNQQARPPTGSTFGSFNSMPASSNQAAPSGNGIDDLLF